jgi:hypothetical protein
MANPLATYTFLPWLRQGLSNTITQAESAANPNLRASVALQLTLRSQGVNGAIPDANLATTTVRLHGPGDVLGIDQRGGEGSRREGAIFKTEPRHWITNYEPNNLAHIEFYDEDFPWRYTPAHADTATHRHRPWIMLIVLEEGEFTDGVTTGKQTPFINIADFTKLPVKEELWAWAHVHVNRNLGADDTVIVNSTGGEIANRLSAVLNENADLAYSRIICPRRLEQNKAYHAFVIPTFETGRVAGLGLDVSKVDDAMRGAWENHPERANLSGGSFPYYHRWLFRTGIEGDFEYLVRLLKPRFLDPRVGQRDIDVQRPGSNLGGIVGPKGNGVLWLGGALRIPSIALSDADKIEADQFEGWMNPPPHLFQRDLASFINLSDDYAALSAMQAHNAPDVPDEIGALPDGSTDPDPLITPPLYGTWHALTKRLLKERNGSAAPNAGNWVHDLNLDPRHRTAAGFGTRVVRERQEDYVNAAWEQVGEVLEANRTLRLYQFGKAVSLSWFNRHLSPISSSAPARFMTLSAPMMNRVVTGGYTVRKQIIDSRVPLAVTGVAMRRALRPGSRLVRALPTATATAVRAGGIVEGLNQGGLATAQPPEVPAGAAQVANVSKALLPHVPGWLIRLLRRYPNSPLWLLITALLLALILFFFGLAAIASALGAVALGVFAWLRKLKSDVAVADSLLPENEIDPAVVDALPQAPNFAIEPFGVITAVPAAGTTDNADSVRFKEALRSSFRLHGDLVHASPPVVRVPLDIGALAMATITTLDPARSIPLRFSKAVRVPLRIKNVLRETFIEAMYYPRIDEPMYRPLADIGSELLLPNLGLIPPDSITLLETNQKFIESYMVGINHEFARELLWREYPTDQRGSYFRQFWDVSGYQDVEGLTADTLREKLYDIPKLHLWSRFSKLGDHDNRQPPGSPPKDEVVLSIRGEVLKRYPTAVIYAHKAAWQMTNGVIDKSLIRIPTTLTAAEESQPPRDKVKTPLYEARVDPDITFFGFDLTATEAKGNPDTDDAGWFFVIKERPGEPRFGLDIDRAGAPINSWSDLAWGDVTTQNRLLRINAAMNEHELTTAPPSSEGPDELAQHLEDKQVKWTRATNAAEVAYVLYQLPVLVAIHAAEMLPKD